MRSTENTELTEAEFLRCYDASSYEKPSFSVDLVVFTVLDEQLQVLLVKRAEHPFKDQWALPGGFLDLQRDGSVEDCAMRKLVEKTGVCTPYLEQLKTYGSCDRDPRGWTATTVYLALMASNSMSLAGNQGVVRWAPVQGEGVDKALAFDHRRILVDAVVRLRSSWNIRILPYICCRRSLPCRSYSGFTKLFCNNRWIKAHFVGGWSKPAC